jgi:hypothetical protein
MAFVRLPVAEKDLLNAESRLCPPQPLSLTQGKPIQIHLAFSDRTLVASVKGGKEVRVAEIDVSSGSFGFWTMGSDYKLTSLTIEAVLDESCLKGR